MKELVTVRRTYEITYEHAEHREYLINELRKGHVIDLGGAGILKSTGKASGYAVKYIGAEEPTTHNPTGFEYNHLDGDAREVAALITETIKRHGRATGEPDDWEPQGRGCKVFRSRRRHIELGETYGHHAVLIVVHDGGDAAPFFNSDYQSYESINVMNKALRDAGYWAEQCTSWYTAIYESRRG